LVVSPLTLRPRNHLFARSWPESEKTDDRINSDFVAGWVLGALGHINGGGVVAVTAFELQGDRGILDPMGRPRPLTSVLEVACGWAGRTVRRVSVSDPLHVAALAVGGSELDVLIANLRPESCTITVQLPGELPAPRVRGVLRSQTEDATRSPLIDAQPTRLTLRLDAYDLVAITGRDPHE
jgi:hypothetical protein